MIFFPLTRPVEKVYPDKRETTDQDDVQKMFAVRMGKRSQEQKNRYLGFPSWLHNAHCIGLVGAEMARTTRKY